MLESHGLFTWGDDAEGLLRDDARDHQPGDRLARRDDRRQAGLRRRGGHEPRRRPSGRAIAARLMPEIRGLIGGGERKVGHFDDSAGRAGIRRLEASCGRWRRSARRCPDHFLRTKIRPLVLDFDPAKPDVDAVDRAASTTAIEAYRADYAAYYERCKHPDIARRCAIPTPVVYLMPGVGMITFAARQGDGAHRRRVLRQRHQRDARRLDGRRPIVGLPEQEAFDIEYWLLEEAKLQRMPKPKSLAGRIALRHRRRRRHRPRHRRRGCCARAPAWCWPTSTQAALDEAGRRASRKAYRQGCRPRRR